MTVPQHDPLTAHRPRVAAALTPAGTSNCGGMCNIVAVDGVWAQGGTRRAKRPLGFEQGGWVVSMRTSLALSILAAGFSLSSVAAADLAPPEDYEETCTVELKKTDSVECLACQTVREGLTGSDRCVRLLEPYCYESVCNAWGGTAFTQVWCRTKSASAPAVPTEITAQLTGTGAAVVPQGGAGGAGGAANCAPLVLGGAAGSAATSTVASAGGGSSAKTTTGTGTAANDPASDGSSDGCSIANASPRTRRPSLLLVGLLGMAMLRSLRRAARGA